MADPQPTLYCMIGLDKPDHVAQRMENRAAHLAHWGALDDRLLFGGPYLDDAGNPVGSMIVVKAETKEEVETLAQNDPYLVNGVFASTEVRRWVWFVNAPATL